MTQDALLLVNLGTPAELTEDAVREYLADFLSDPNVIDRDPEEWAPILEKILENRPKESLKAYEKIWMNEGSPLRVYTESLTEKVAKNNPDTRVSYAMTYGKPGIAQELQAIDEANVTDLTIMPLFPQYTMSSSRAVFQQVVDYYYDAKRIPRVSFISYYYDQQGYIDSVVEKIEDTYSKNDFEVLICSYHGIAQHKIDQGDPRAEQTTATTRSIENTLSLDLPVIHAYQSEFGDVKWTEPKLLEVLDELADKGIKKVGVVAPSFAAECVETLEELALDAAEHFEDAGGEELVYIPCVNDSDRFAAFVSDFAIKGHHE